MTTIEKVDKLRERANVSYDEAKEALDASDGDILEAMIYLERKGKVEAPKDGGYYSTQPQSESEKDSNHSNTDDYQNGVTFASLLGKFFRWAAKMIAKGNVNTFDVQKNNAVILTVPVTVLVVFLIFAFWIVVPLIIVGLFFGFRYFFNGPDLEKTEMNNIMDSAAEAAENLKKEVKEEHQKKAD